MMISEKNSEKKPANLRLRIIVGIRLQEDI